MSDFSKLKTIAQAYSDLIDSEDQDSWAEARDEYELTARVDVVLELIAEVESLRKDAARYRWLRKEAVMFHVSCEGSNNKDAYLSVTGWGDDDSSEIIDNAVDFEMKKQ